jgi:hypothetical protein
VFLNAKVGLEFDWAHAEVLAFERELKSPLPQNKLSKRYDIFAYLDMDDLFFPSRIESLLPLFDRYDMVFAAYEILEKGRLTLWNIWALWESQSYVYICL